MIRRVFASGPVRDFMLVASPALEVREAQLDDVRVAHWGLPGGESNWGTVLDVARGSIAVFEERFGPYPYAELDVVAAPLQNAGGVEYPGLILIAADAYLDDEAAIFLQVATAHEVAHQWWYGIVGNDVLADPWQDEALTTYSSGLYFEEHNRTLYRALLTSYELSVEGFKDDQGDEPIAQPLDAFQGRSETYGMIVYLKGALFFAAVRDEIDDEAFFRALQAYYARGRFQIASPETLLAAFEDSCACDLDALYEEWGVIAP